MLQEDSLHDSPRDQSVADKSIDPQLILLGFFEGGVPHLLSSTCQGSPLISTTFERAALLVHFCQHPSMQALQLHLKNLMKKDEEILTQSSSLSGSSLNPFKKHGSLGDLVGED